VRNLAQRSAQAAKEIKELIGDSVSKVDGGSELVARAGQTMDEIVQAVKRVTDIMAEVTVASEEQSSGIEQVNQAVTQMDKVTQQNATLVEQVAAAASSLEGQAQRLQDAVAVFQVAESKSKSKSEAQQRQQRSSTPLTVAKRSQTSPGAKPAPVKRAPQPLLKTVDTLKARNGAGAGVGKATAARAGQALSKAPAVKLAASNTDDWETF